MWVKKLISFSEKLLMVQEGGMTGTSDGRYGEYRQREQEIF
jgi:hypothetical protein